MSDHKVLMTRWWVKFRAYNTQYEVSHTHPKFEQIKALLRDGQTRKAVTAYNSMVNTRKAIKRGVVVRGNELYARGRKLPDGLRELYLRVAGKVNADAMHRFLLRFADNPSAPSREAFARFLSGSHNRVCITDRGTMLLYKRVRPDYTDCHTGTFDNSPGRLVEVDRKAVDPDPNRLCSNGLHVCSYRYLGEFHSGWTTYSTSGNPTIVVEVDPRDVVSVPTDHGNSKIRVCRYRVWFDTRDFNRTGYEDFLGDLQYYDTAGLAAAVAAARVPPKEDITRDWTRSGGAGKADPARAAREERAAKREARRTARKTPAAESRQRALSAPGKAAKKRAEKIVRQKAAQKKAAKKRVAKKIVQKKARKAARKSTRNRRSR